MLSTDVSLTAAQPNPSTQVGSLPVDVDGAKTQNGTGRLTSQGLLVGAHLQGYLPTLQAGQDCQEQLERHVLGTLQRHCINQDLLYLARG